MPRPRIGVDLVSVTMNSTGNFLPLYGIETMHLPSTFIVVPLYAVNLALDL